MACDRKTLMLISCYADGEAIGEEATRAAAHLESCADCRKLVEEWQGSRQLLEWVCTFELPEEIDVKDRHAVVAERTTSRPVLPRLRWNWLTVVGLAAVVAVGFAAYWFATLPPMLNVGKSLVTTGQSGAARMGSDVRLTLGPNSKIVRGDERTISLLRGWVVASVSGGSSIEVDSPRLKVTDRGTRFKVGTQPKLDYVLVEEGAVSVSGNGGDRDVKAGQALSALDGQKMSVADLPADKSEDIARSKPLGRHEEDRPRTATELHWEEGRQRLADRFPGLRILWDHWDGASSTAWDSRQHGGISYYGLCPLIGFRDGLREHFGDIAEALVGGTVYSGYWEIPVGVMQASGIVSSPRCSDDAYYVQLVCETGTVKWRFNSSRGGYVEYPLRSHEYREAVHSSGPLVGETCGRRHETGVTEWVTEWPGQLKPALEIAVGYASNEANLAAIRRAIAPVTEATGTHSWDWCSQVYYLDPGKRRHVIVVWNSDSVKDLCRLSDGMKREQGGTVVLGLFETDVPLDEPRLAAGVHVLRFVLDDHSRAPHLEIAAASRAYALRTRKLESETDGPGRSCMPDPPDGYGRVDLEWSASTADSEGFALHFRVKGRPDDLSTRDVNEKNGGYSFLAPSKVWAEGWVRIKKL